MNETLRYRLRIYTADAHRIEGRPAYEFIVHSAFEQGIAGATVLRGIAGFGHSHRVHTTKIVAISEDLPVIVEMIDDMEKLKSFAEQLRIRYTKGMITLDEVRCWL